MKNLKKIVYSFQSSINSLVFKKMFESFKITNLFGTDLLKSIKLNQYPPVHYEEYLNNISFRQIKVKTNNVDKNGTFFNRLINWANNWIFILATIAFTISFFKNDEDSIYYGKFNLIDGDNN